MDLHLINARLRDIYGTDLLKQPIYRVVWSDDQIEKRFSTFRDFLEGTDIFLREVTEVRECRKYRDYPKQYILEKQFFNQHNKEILANDSFDFARTTYEPVWAFGQEDNGLPKPVVWRAIELILMSINNPKKLTPSQMSDSEFEQAKKDELLFQDLLNKHVKNDSLHSAIKDGDTIMLGRGTTEAKSDG